MIKSIQTRFDFFPYLQWRRYDNPSGLYDPIDNGIELLFIEGLLEDYSIRTFQNTNRVLDSTTLSTYSDYKFGAFVNEKMLMPQVGFPGLFELKNCTRTQFSKYAEYKWDPIVFGPVSEDLPPFQTLVGLYKNYSALEGFSGSVYTPTIYINQESRISSFTGTSKIGSIVIHGYTSGG